MLAGTLIIIIGLVLYAWAFTAAAMGASSGADRELALTPETCLVPGVAGLGLAVAGLLLA